MSSRKTNSGLWVGGVIVIVIAALVLWWISSGLPLNTSTDMATSTQESAPTKTIKKTGVTGTKSTNASGITVVNSSMDVATIVANLPEATTFNLYFTSTGVASTLNPKAPNQYTVFVPTNASIARLPAGTISTLPTAEKRRFAEYHVISGRALDADALISGQVQALSRDMLNVSYTPTKAPMINSAKIIAEYHGVNGVVYVIDGVLLPPKKSGI